MGWGKGRWRPFWKGPAATGRGDGRAAPRAPQSCAAKRRRGGAARVARIANTAGGRRRREGAGARTSLEGLEHAVRRARSLGEGHDAVARLPRVRDRVRGRVTVGVDRQLRVRVAARVLGRVRVGGRIHELGQGKGRSGLGPRSGLRPVRGLGAVASGRPSAPAASSRTA